MQRCEYALAASYEFEPPKPAHDEKAYSGAVLSSQASAEWVDVDDVEYKRHQKDGKPDSVRVIYKCGLQYVSEWLCPDHGGYAESRYVARMPALGAKALTTTEALTEAPVSWTIPSRIKIKPRANDPRFFEIVQLDYSEGRKPPPPGEELAWDEDELERIYRFENAHRKRRTDRLFAMVGASIPNRLDLPHSKRRASRNQRCQKA
jgi:hypothetical protein